MTWRSVEAHVAGEDCTLLASMAKLKGTRLQREVNDACLQYWGGMGYVDETPVSRRYRDGRLTSIGARRRRDHAWHHRQTRRTRFGISEMTIALPRLSELVARPGWKRAEGRHRSSKHAQRPLRRGLSMTSTRSLGMSLNAPTSA